MCLAVLKFFFRNSVQFLRAFKNMYLCYNIVACVAGVNGEGVGRGRKGSLTPVPQYQFPLIIKRGAWGREHMFEE